jgi:putative membrane protein
MKEDNSNGKQAHKEDPGQTSLPESAATSGSGGGVKKEIRKVLTRIESLLGFGPVKTEEHKDEAGDVSTRLARERTDLALDRSYLAADRTLMAWIRTALSMISFGFTIGKLGQYMDSINTRGIFGASRTVSIESLAYFLVLLGTVSLLGAVWQYKIRMRQLRAMGFNPSFNIAFYVGLLLVAVGGFALTSLVMSL